MRACRQNILLRNVLYLCTFLCTSRVCDSLSNNNHNNVIDNARRTIVGNTLATIAGLSLNSDAAQAQGDTFAGQPDQGISIVTDSSVGRAFRRSAINGAKTLDNLDEKWEGFSDSLRDKNKCDEATGRRLFDNGFRKDGTRIGNPVLGGLCKREPLLPLDESMVEGGFVLEAAFRCALKAGETKGDAEALKRSIGKVQELVRPSFDRSISEKTSEEEKKRKQLNFALYSYTRAIDESLRPTSSSSLSLPTIMKKFQIAWGSELVARWAPNANRADYYSPFPDKKDEFEDFDYDKGLLLDSLGTLKVALDQMKKLGVIGYYEIVIPYDDYGSVVTVAIDDYVPIGSEILLTEQNQNRIAGGPIQAMVRSLMDRAMIDYDSLDSFFIDPYTTNQNEYNPSQLLLNLNGLRKRKA